MFELGGGAVFGQGGPEPLDGGVTREVLVGVRGGDVGVSFVKWFLGR